VPLFFLALGAMIGVSASGCGKGDEKRSDC
jgi:hypothetical protein